MCASTFTDLTVMFCVVSIFVSTGRLYILSKFDEVGEGAKLSRNLLIMALLALSIGLIMNLLTGFAMPC
jgi:hypothetical protein